MNKCFIKTAAILGAVSVALGAFAAHGLKSIATEEVVSIFETAVRYQFYHVFALLAVGITYSQGKEKLLKWAGSLFIIGIILFSGSLYLITFFKVNSIAGMEWVGPVTPLGGVCLIAGWLMFFGGVAQKKSEK